MTQSTEQKKNLDAIVRHFKERDPLVFAVFADMPLESLKKEEDASRYFAKLCREIIAQQLGSKAAAAILARFGGLFKGGHPTPAEVLALSEQALRDIGMSWAKARYVRDVAAKVAAGDVDLPGLHALGNEQAIAELSQIKGIGRWTAEMFLIFTLGREDVFSFGDLGLKKGLALIYGKRKTATERQISRITGVWAPYRSYGSLAVWHVADNAKKKNVT